MYLCLHRVGAVLYACACCGENGLCGMLVGMNNSGYEWII